MSRVFRWHWIFGSAVFLTLAMAQSGDSKCPSESGTRVSDGGYTFVYDSVIDKSKFGSKLIRCIQNQTDQDMYVRWEGIPIEGYARPKGKKNSVIEHSIPIINNLLIQKDSALWFGTDRYKTSAPFLALSSQESSQKPSFFPLVTRIKMSIPNDSSDLSAGFLDLDLSISSSGSFNSSSSKSFFSTLSTDQDNLYLQWYSKAVVVTTTKLNAIKLLEIGKKLTKSSVTKNAWTILQKGTPEAVIQPLIFVDRNGLSVGNAQVVLYRAQ